MARKRLYTFKKTGYDVLNRHGNMDMNGFSIQLEPNFPGSPVYLGVGAYDDEINNPAAKRLAIMAQQEKTIVIISFEDFFGLAAKRNALSCEGMNNPVLDYQKDTLKKAIQEVCNKEVPVSFSLDRNKWAISYLNGFSEPEMISANIPNSLTQVAVCEVRGIYKGGPFVASSNEYESGFIEFIVPEIVTQSPDSWVVGEVDGKSRAYPIPQVGLRLC